MGCFGKFKTLCCGYCYCCFQKHNRDSHEAHGHHRTDIVIDEAELKSFHSTAAGSSNDSSGTQPPSCDQKFSSENDHSGNLQISSQEYQGVQHQDLTSSSKQDSNVDEIDPSNQSAKHCQLPAVEHGSHDTAKSADSVVSDTSIDVHVLMDDQNGANLSTATDSMIPDVDEGQNKVVDIDHSNADEQKDNVEELSLLITPNDAEDNRNPINADAAGIEPHDSNAATPEKTSLIMQDGGEDFGRLVTDFSLSNIDGVGITKTQSSTIMGGDNHSLLSHTDPDESVMMNQSSPAILVASSPPPAFIRRQSSIEQAVPKGNVQAKKSIFQMISPMKPEIGKK
jgi:hypothetical protein